MRSPPLRFAPFRALVLDYYTTPLRSTCEPKLVSQNLDSKVERKKLSQNLRFKTWAQKLELKTWAHKLEPKLGLKTCVQKKIEPKLEVQNLITKNWAKAWGSKLERKNLSSKLDRINLSPKNLSAKNLSGNLFSTFGGQNLKVKTKKRMLYRHNTNTKPNPGQHHSSFYLPAHSSANKL